MRLSDVISDAGEAALPCQRPDGSFAPGHNGPYQDPETPVRNTAHWLLTLLRAHELRGDARFADAAARAAAYLASPAARPHGATFLCRTNPNKDFCNGVIGQAWVIEALAAASAQLGDLRWRELAAKVFLLHPFDVAAGIWRRRHIDGRIGEFDTTFNHQFWFAAAGALLDDDPHGVIGSRVLRFLARAGEAHFRVARSGRILHRFAAPVGSPARTVPESADAMVRKEIAYHAFNLYAFALLRQRIASHAIWASAALRAALDFVASDEFLAGLDDNRFAYPYNPVGFEVAFALQVFAPAARHPERSDRWWVERQLARRDARLQHGTAAPAEDRVTGAARLYEATRLADVELALPSARAAAAASPAGDRGRHAGAVP